MKTSGTTWAGGLALGIIFFVAGPATAATKLPDSCISFTEKTLNPNIGNSNNALRARMTNTCGSCAKYGVILMLNGQNKPQLGVYTSQANVSETMSFPFQWDPGQPLTADVRANDVWTCN